MTLLISVFAAAISTAIWYKNAPESQMKFEILCWLFWGSSLMWFVDACFEYAEVGVDFFKPELSDMLNDCYLGLSVVALALVVWIISLLISDPKGVIKDILLKK